jgi:hypothetical protein
LHLFVSRQLNVTTEQRTLEAAVFILIMFVFSLALLQYLRYLMQPNNKNNQIFKENIQIKR